MIAGMSGDSGKTLLSLGLLASWRRDGLCVAPFKKGPDYIDAAWLSRIAGTACRNLDTFLMGEEEVRRAFVTHAAGADIALVEGNRGLFDGMDAEGSHSSARLARLIDTPVLLVLGVRKVTRSVAAWLLGCRAMDPELNIAGVVLNGVAGPRHERVVRESVESACGIPVIGALPWVEEGGLLPDRHLGLVTPAETRRVETMESELAGMVSRHVDCLTALELARTAGPMEVPAQTTGTPGGGAGEVSIAYFSDSAFTFYYPENLESLERSGARLTPLSSLESTELPAGIHGLYIGGGFPETHAARIAGNRGLFASLRAAVACGLPVYAECGGLIYLARTLRWNDEQHEMSGVLPITVELGRRPAGHGYQMVTVDRENPFYPVGTELRGHEFHYSRVVDTEEPVVNTAFDVRRGSGALAGRDGLVQGNVLATYLHLHARGTPQWAAGLVRKAADYRDRSVDGVSRDAKLPYNIKTNS